MANALALQAPTFVVFPEQDLYQAAADRLGALQAEIAPLRNQEEAIKEILRTCPDMVVEGRNFRCTISEAKATQSVDWEGIARSIASEARLTKLVPAFTATKEPGKSRISVKARKGL